MADEATVAEAPRLQLLGRASITGPRPVARLDKRAAALVAYLAVEGPTPRSRLAGLLWPEARETTARNNLAQAVRRLKSAAGVPVVVGTDLLELDRIGSDAADLVRLADAGRTAEAALLEGELLAGYDLDEQPDLDAWLRAARGHLTRLWTRAVVAERDRCEASGDFDQAIAWAEKLVAADPISEAAHLSVARLLLARGDAPAAMRAYERCRKTLAKELAMKPSAAMIEVYRAIREGAPARGAARVARPPLPAQVLRPQWVGRSREWAAVERAVAGRQAVVVSGEPGVGKSRLLRDSAAARGSAAVFEGRPGDRDVPFSTLARGLRAIVGKHAGALPGWARAEIGRVLPELAEDEGGATSMRTKVRFFEAILLALQQGAERGIRSLVLDDMQWFDAASGEVLAAMADRAARGELNVAVLAAHRSGELSDEVGALVARAVEAGTAVRLALGPLEPAEIAKLLDSLALPVVEGRVAAISEASRGVPLYALEIVRSLADAPAPGDATPLPIPERVRSLLARRLERLGEGALRLARVVAIAGPEFDLDLAAHVLDRHPVDLADALAELERTQIVTGTRFAHDLLADAVRDALPAAVRQHVHARTADWLAQRGADPARVAQHLEAAGRTAEAAPFLVRAASAARGLSRVADAIALFDRAAHIFESAGDLRGASEALYLRTRSHMGADADDLLTRLDRVATTDRDRARAACTRANVALEAGRLDEARRVARDALELARAAGERLVETESLQALLDVEMRSGNLDEADAAYALFREASTALADDPEADIASAFYEGELLTLRDRHEAAIARFDETLAMLERWGQLAHGKAGILAHVARSALARGELARADAALAQAASYLADATGAPRPLALLRLAQAAALRVRRELDAARDALRALAAPDFEMRDVLAAREVRAEIALELGELDAAERDLDAVARDERAEARTRAAAALGLTRLALARESGVPACEAAVVEALGGPEQRATLACLVAWSTADDAEASAGFTEALATARALGLAPLEARARALSAERLAASGRLGEARTDAEAACAAVDAGVLGGLDAELALAARALVAPETRAQALAVILRPLAQVPGITRARFLEAFPHRRALATPAADRARPSSSRHRR